MQNKFIEDKTHTHTHDFNQSEKGKPRDPT